MKKVLNMLGLIMFLLTINSFAQESEMNPEAAKFYNEGNKLMKAGQYKAAVEQYNSALKLGDDYRIYYQKGVTLKKLRDYSEAESALVASTKAKDDFAVAYNALGGIYFIEGKYAEAVETFKKFEQLSEKTSLKEKANEYISRSYAKLGLNAKTDGRYEDAISYLNNAVKYFDYDAAYLTLAEVYIENGDYNKALEAADKALNFRKSISKGGPLYYKGLAFKKSNDVGKAKEAFEEGKKDPKYKALCEYELKLL